VHTLRCRFSFILFLHTSDKSSSYAASFCFRDFFVAQEEKLQIAYTVYDSADNFIGVSVDIFLQHKLQKYFDL
jgi:hypothetical protein